MSGRVVVLGGSGFLGSHLCDQLLARGDEVVCVDDLSTGRRENVNPRARFYEVDIRSEELTAIIARERPEIVSHQAAQMDVRNGGAALLAKHAARCGF